jgi:ribosomal protein S18 acetylase RimI-like enzyme/GNAT superfamily N-acetyltransferase
MSRVISHPIDDHFTFRTMTIEDLRLALSWAKEEGWNPGIEDAVNFFCADPEGFFLGEIDGEPISCISVVKYPENFNFVGIYIVRPEYRAQGYGFRTWQDAFRRIPGQPAALDAVLAQVATYQKSGFQPAHSHLRYEGVIAGEIAEEVRDLNTIELDRLCHFDRRYFPSARRPFLENWITQPNARGYAVVNDGELAGYGVIRKASEGFKIAPLFAENRPIAEKLYLSLATYAGGEPIYLDVPNCNRAAIEWVESYGMRSMFECVRMYKGKPPAIHWTGVFAVTSLEVG